MRSQIPSWLVSLGIAALFAAFNAGGHYRASNRIMLNFDIRVKEARHLPPLLQIYYDQGRGFEERHSMRVVLPGKGAVKHIRTMLPVQNLQALRLDYLNGAGRVEIARLSLTDALGTPLVDQWHAERFTPYQTESLRQSGDTLHVQSGAQADDPHLALLFDPALRAPRQGKAMASLVFGGKIFLILALSLELLLLVIGKSWLSGWRRPRETPPARQRSRPESAGSESAGPEAQTDSKKTAPNPPT